jgi:hypothetical protein
MKAFAHHDAVGIGLGFYLQCCQHQDDAQAFAQ